MPTLLVSTDILEQSRQPDEELVDLIEQAFREEQIDSQKAGLAYLWLRQRSAQCKAKKWGRGLGDQGRCF